MTIQEWEKKIDNAKSPQEVEALMRQKPKGAKNIRTGAPVIRQGRTDLPFLKKLTSKTQK